MGEEGFENALFLPGKTVSNAVERTRSRTNHAELPSELAAIALSWDRVSDADRELLRDIAERAIAIAKPQESSQHKQQATAARDTLNLEELPGGFCVIYGQDAETPASECGVDHNEDATGASQTTLPADRAAGRVPQERTFSPGRLDDQVENPKLVPAAENRPGSAPGLSRMKP